jgi:hypothetical protein
MKTEDFIVGLAREAHPVRRLPPPWRRARLWAVATAIYLAAVVVFMAPPDRLATAFGDLRFLFEQVAAALVGLTASAAALATVVPGHSRRVLIAPIAASLLWIATVAIGGWHDALRYGAAGTGLQTDWPCMVAITMIAIPPAVALVRMLQYGAPLTSRLTLALAALSAAGFANVAACVMRPHESTLTVLLWHGTLALVLCGIAALLGTSVLNWSRAASSHQRTRQPSSGA